MAGVFWFGWDAGIIVFLYWVENVVIGLLNIPKILACRKTLPAVSYRATGGDEDYQFDEADRREPIGGLIFLSVFFSFHYGLFCVGHYVFLKSTYKTLPEMVNILPALLCPVLFWSLLGLTLSHIISMGVNFYGKGEYKNRTSNKQMFMPYSRIVLLHIVIIFSGLVAVATGQGMATLLLLVLLKIGFDLAAHLVEHSEKESLIAPSVD